MIRFDILTVFPEMFASPLGCSLLKKAADRGLISVHLHDIRDHARDKHRMTDDAPYGGGGGMVMKVEPIDRTLQTVPRIGAETPIILMTPQGERFCQKMAEELAGRLAAGVAVRGVFERRGAGSPSSRDEWLAARGAEILLDGNPGAMHHKVIIVDGAAVAAGSYNFSESAEKRNDENMLIVHDPGVAGQFLREMDRVAAAAKAAEK